MAVLVFQYNAPYIKPGDLAIESSAMKASTFSSGRLRISMLSPESLQTELVFYSDSDTVVAAQEHSKLAQTCRGLSRQRFTP